MSFINDSFPLKTLRELAEEEIPATFYYLATPYAKYVDGREKAFEEALSYANILLQAGVPVFSPIVHSHPIATKTNGLDAEDYDTWLTLDKSILRGSSGVLIAPMIGWRLSKGIAMEIEEANLRRLPVFLLDMHW
jgi:hypothetical protein